MAEPAEGREGEVLALAQDMTISRESFLRLLPAALAHVPFAVDGADIRPLDGTQGWRIALSALPDLRLGAIALPRQHVEIWFGGYDAERARAFLERFELYYRRGGG